MDIHNQILHGVYPYDVTPALYGQAVCLKRLEAKMTANELAEALSSDTRKITEMQIVKIELGKYEHIPLSLAKDIDAVLNN